jgi:uncharacterized repeat protein (TIGR03803 family)
MRIKRKLPLVVFFALLAGGAFAASPQPATVHTFTCNAVGSSRTGPCPSGAGPASLIQGSDGNFYGAAQISMEGSSAANGGVVFSLTPTGTYTVVHTFVPGPGHNYANGNFPTLLTEGPDGMLYGYTTFGGLDGCDDECGYGVIYRMNRNGSAFQVVHEFCSAGDCGDLRPTATAMVTGTDGNLYGTIAGDGGSPYGSIFRITTSTGAYGIVLNFNFSTGEGIPSGLTAAPDGTFYALALGALPALLFHYTPATGDLTTVSINFPVFDTFSPSGPTSGLTFGPNGNLYGLYAIYAVGGLGLFEMETHGGNLQCFPFFETTEGGGSPDGLMLASDGNFWMAEYYGSDSYGNIMQLSPANGALLKTLSPFSPASPVGAYPKALIQAKDGILWGATYDYGAAATGQFALGTVFSLSAGLPAP